MKKLDVTNAIAILSLGLTLSVVGAGFATNSVSANSLTMTTPTTKAPKTGSSDSGTGSGKTKTTTKTGSSDSGTGSGKTKTTTKTGSSDSGTGNGTTKSVDGGTGKSVTVSDSDLYSSYFGKNVLDDTKVKKLTKVQMNALTATQWEEVDGYLSVSQVASIPTKTIKNLTTTALVGLTKSGTQALTTAQLNSMSKDQLNALVSTGELTADQTVTVTTRLTKLG